VASARGPTSALEDVPGMKDGARGRVISCAAEKGKWDHSQPKSAIIKKEEEGQAWKNNMGGTCGDRCN